MLVCHHGNLTISVGVRASLQLAIVLLILIQARSVDGRNPVSRNGTLPRAIRTQLVSASPREAATPPALHFDETRIDDAREGHATLTWNALDGASTDRVRDAAGRLLYSGVFPQAFVSGLEDGEHRFSVSAIDAAGQTIATSRSRAQVVVKHWPLSQALLLFAIGGMVFIALVVVLIYGAIACHTNVCRTNACRTNEDSVGDRSAGRITTQGGASQC